MRQNEEGRRSETVARRIDVGGPTASTGDDRDVTSDLERLHRVGDQAFVRPPDVHPDLTGSVTARDANRHDRRQTEHGLIDDGRLGGREPVEGCAVGVRPGQGSVVSPIEFPILSF